MPSLSHEILTLLIAVALLVIGGGSYVFMVVVVQASPLLSLAVAIAMVFLGATGIRLLK